MQMFFGCEFGLIGAAKPAESSFSLYSRFKFQPYYQTITFMWSLFIALC